MMPRRLGEHRQNPAIKSAIVRAQTPDKEIATVCATIPSSWPTSAAQLNGLTVSMLAGSTGCGNIVTGERIEFGIAIF
jgi:hypothetical protein